MPILSGGPLYKDKTKPIEEYQSSLGETAAAAFNRAVDTGLSDVALGAAQMATFNFTEGAQNIGRTFGVDVAAEINPSNRVTAADARQQAAKRGVKLDIADDAYFSPGELGTVLALKERERKQKAVLDRRPQTWAGFGAEMGGGLAGSLVDPVQVAASFIPVVPAVRYAAWLERAGSAGGRALVRTGVGAAEGLVGSAVIEPFAYSRAQSLGLDYTAQDSFLNLAFGTVLGGGLHVTGGAIGDALSPARRAAAVAPEVKSREALAEAVTALDAGRALDVDPVFRDPRMNAANDTAFMAREISRSDVLESDIAVALDDLKAVKAGLAEKPADLIDTIKSLGGIKIVDNNGRITPEGGDVRDIFNKRYPIGLVNNRDGIPLDYVREALQEQGWLPRAADGMPDETTTADVLDMLSRWNSGDKPLPVGEVRGQDMRPIADEVKAAGVKPSDSEDIAAFKLAKYRAEKARMAAPELVREPAIAPDSYDPATGYEPPEYEALRMEADRAMASRDDIDGEIEALNEMLAMAEKREPLNEFDRAALDLADKFETTARRSGDTYRAAASCLSGLA
jgi:hypothetical protein